MLTEGPELARLLVLLRRRWRSILILPLATAAISLAFADPPPTVYRSQLAFAVDIPRSALLEGSDEGTAAKIGESLVDDLARIVGRDRFAAAVAARLPAGQAPAPGEIAAELSAEDKHRILEVSVSRPLPGGADDAAADRLAQEVLDLARAVQAELEEDGSRWFARLGEDAVALSLIDAPEPALPQPPGLRQRLDLPLRLVLALLVGLAIAALREGLDRRIHGPAELAEVGGLRLLARIPRRR